MEAHPVLEVDQALAVDPLKCEPSFLLIEEYLALVEVAEVVHQRRNQAMRWKEGDLGCLGVVGEEALAGDPLKCSPSFLLSVEYLALVEVA